MFCMREFHVDIHTNVQWLKHTQVIWYKNNVKFGFFCSYFVWVFKDAFSLQNFVLYPNSTTVPPFCKVGCRVQAFLSWEQWIFKAIGKQRCESLWQPYWEDVQHWCNRTSACSFVVGVPFCSSNTCSLQIAVLGSCNLKNWTSPVKATKFRLSPFCCLGPYFWFLFWLGFVLGFVCFCWVFLVFCLFVFWFFVLVSLGFGFSFDWLAGFWKGNLYLPGSIHLHISASDSSCVKTREPDNFLMALFVIIV